TYRSRARPSPPRSSSSAALPKNRVDQGIVVPSGHRKERLPLDQREGAGRTAAVRPPAACRQPDDWSAPTEILSPVFVLVSLPLSALSCPLSPDFGPPSPPTSAVASSAPASTASVSTALALISPASTPSVLTPS